MHTGKTVVRKLDASTSSCEAEGENLRNDVKLLLKKFLLNTSLHGCSPIPKSDYHWFRRLLWMLLLATSTSAMLVYVVDFYVSYNKHPFITKNHLVRVKSLSLPAISVCTDEFKKGMINNSDNYEEYFIVKKNQFVQTFGDFNVTVPSDEELDQQSFRSLEKNSLNKDIILTATIKNIDVKSEFRSLTSFFGQCLTYNMVDQDGDGGNITLSYGQSVNIIFNITQDVFFSTTCGGIMLIFHDPVDFPTSASIEVTAAPGFMTNIYLKATELKFLPKPYKSFGEEYCVESTESASNGEKRSYDYTWLGCVEKCGVKKAVKLCDCTVNFRTFAGNWSHRVCSSEEFNECFAPILQSVFEGILRQNQTACSCPRPCQFIQYDVRTTMRTFPSKPVADFLVKHGAVSSYRDLSDNYLSVDISFDRMVLHQVEHVPEIDSGDIFGKLGGQMGIFVGASLLTLMEIAETMALAILRLRKYVFRSIRRLKVGASM